MRGQGKCIGMRGRAARPAVRCPKDRVLLPIAQIFMPTVQTVDFFQRFYYDND